METAGWMRHAYDAVVAHQVERYGDTVAVRRKAAMLMFDVFGQEGYPESFVVLDQKARQAPSFRGGEG